MSETFTCPKCGKDKKFASLGYGNIAFCCDTIYSDEDMNRAKEQLTSREAKDVAPFTKKTVSQGNDQENQHKSQF